jgi:carbohydrate-selective porin OprB
MKKFSEYLEYKAPFMSRLGSAIGSGFNAAKNSMNQQTLTRPSSAGGDDYFHQAELDMKAISELVEKIKTPEIKKAVDALSDKVGRWVYNKYR